MQSLVGFLVPFVGVRMKHDEQQELDGKDLDLVGVVVPKKQTKHRPGGGGNTFSVPTCWSEAVWD